MENISPAFGIKPKQPVKKKKPMLTKRAIDEIVVGFKKFKKIIENAKKKGLNESDTSNIINDMLGEVWGYDKYFDVTTEYKIKGQYCDYGVKIEGKLEFLLEVKAIGIDLNDNHLFQASSYAGNEGIKRVVLTNLHQWQIYHLSFGSKIEKDLILEFDILGSEKPQKLYEYMSYVHKESFRKKNLDVLLKQKTALSEKNIKKILFSSQVLKKIQSIIRYETGMKISEEETKNILQSYLK